MKRKEKRAFLDQIDSVILSNIKEVQILMIISEHFKLSSSQIYRRIKQQSGLPPSKYVRKKRLEAARELILFSDLTLTEIAYRVGFQELSYFSKCFTKFYGHTPSILRKGRF